jgi:hypothetical protein
MALGEPVEVIAPISIARLWLQTPLASGPGTENTVQPKAATKSRFSGSWRPMDSTGVLKSDLAPQFPHLRDRIDMSS